MSPKASYTAGATGTLSWSATGLLTAHLLWSLLSLSCTEIPVLLPENPCSPDYTGDLECHDGTPEADSGHPDDGGPGEGSQGPQEAAPCLDEGTGEILERWCLINAICYRAGTGHPEDDCRICRPSNQTADWTDQVDGAPCRPSEGVPQEDADGGEADADAEGMCSAGICLPLREGCICAGDTFCCDGCIPRNTGVLCSDDGMECTEQRCSSLGVCGAPVILPGWCIVDDTCFSTQSDPDNCGSCGQVCPDGQICMRGECVPPPHCPGEQTLCGDRCADLVNDDAHCGACFAPCSPEQTCRGGQCVTRCQPGEIHCGAACVQLGDNGEHCGDCFRSCQPGQICQGGDCITPVTSVAITPAQLDLQPGQSHNLQVNFTPPESTDRTLVWSSSAPTIASVDHAGRVTAVAPGQALINATSRDGGHTAQCRVAVGAVSVTGVTINPASTIINVGGQLSLQAIVSPPNATDRRVVWESSSALIVSVNQTGVATGLWEGYATITATSLDGGHAGVCELYVKVPPDSISVLPSPLRVARNGGTGQLTVTVEPPETTNPMVIWRSDAPEIATVDASGLVTGGLAGHTVVQAITQDGGLQASAEVVVGTLVSDVLLNTVNLELEKGESARINAVVLPTDATHKVVTWHSTNPDSAQVDQGGLVTATGAGQAQVVATTEDGGYTASCQVKVRVPVTGLQLEPSSLTVPRGGIDRLSPIFSPEDASSRNISWVSLNPSVAQVNNHGVVSGLEIGEGVIQATTQDGGHVATASVLVNVPVTGVSLEPSVVRIALDRTVTLTARLVPEDASDGQIAWHSVNPQVAEVDAQGVLSPHNTGETTIVVTTRDGSHQATSQVTVTPPIGWLMVQPGSFQMGSPGDEPGRSTDEGPVQVTLTRPFMAMAAPVTQSQWHAVMGNTPSAAAGCGGSCPVESVSWWDAIAYCNALSTQAGLPHCYTYERCSFNLDETIHSCEGLSVNAPHSEPQACNGYRLPTEAEWEYMTRAGTTSAFNTGPITNTGSSPLDEALDLAGWYSGNSSTPMPVAMKSPNPWGLLDVHGNVSEWVWDWYQGHLSGPVADPLGPPSGNQRVIRGGSWQDEARRCRSASRGSSHPSWRSPTTGFRIVRTMP